MRVLQSVALRCLCTPTSANAVRDEVSEAVLAHGDPDQVRAVFSRKTFLDDRRIAMQACAEFVVGGGPKSATSPTCGGRYCSKLHADWLAMHRISAPSMASAGTEACGADNAIQWTEIAALPMALIPLWGVGISGVTHLIAFDMPRR